MFKLSNIAVNKQPNSANLKISFGSKIYYIDNPLLKELIDLIEQYNLLSRQEFGQKRQLLAAINDKRMALDNQTPFYLNDYHDYWSGGEGDDTDYFREALFLAIKEECKALGMRSILMLKTHSNYVNYSPLMAPEIIANMSMQEMSIFVDKLLPDDANSDPDNDARGSLEALNRLKNNYKILPISTAPYGIGERAPSETLETSPILVKVNSNHDESSYILSIAKRNDRPKRIEASLRDGVLSSLFTPVLAQQHARLSVSSIWLGEDGWEGDFEPFTVLLTDEFCNLKELSSTYGSSKKRLSSAGELFVQMGVQLLELTESGFAFTDMNNINWAYYPNGKLRIHNAQSILHSHMPPSNGFLMASMMGKMALLTSRPSMIKGNQGYNTLIQSITAPEFNSEEPFAVDAMHAYLLGINLYQYLTNSSASDLSQINFEQPIFKQPLGNKFKQLIEKLIVPSPQERMSVAMAVRELSSLELMCRLDENKPQLSRARGQFFAAASAEANSSERSGYIPAGSLA